MARDVDRFIELAGLTVLAFGAVMMLLAFAAGWLLHGWLG